MRLLAALLAAFLVHCAAAPFAVQVGEARIGLDAPPGFADTTFTGSPRLQELAESLTSPSNRILLFALSDGDLRRFMVGDALELRRYMMVVTPRGIERERVSEGIFKQFIGESLAGLGTPQAEKDPVKFLDSRPSGATSLLPELAGRRRRVGAARRAHQGRRLLRALQVPAVQHQPAAAARQGAQSFGLPHYDDPADLEWIRVTTARWIDELKRLNSR